MLPSKATAPAPSAAAASKAAIRRRARSSSTSEAPYSSLMIGTCAGWMQDAVVKPSALPRFRPGPIGVEVVDVGQLPHRAHGQDAGRPRRGQALHGEDVHAVGRGDGAELGRHVLAADRHAGHARLGGDGVEMRQRRRQFDQDEEARMADRHAEGRLAVAHQLGQQADMLGPHDLGQHQRRDARHDRCRDVGDGEIDWPVDAHHDVGALLGDARHGGGQRGAGVRFARRQDRVLEIEDDGIGAALMCLRQKALREHRHEQQRSPGGLGPGHSMFSSQRVASRLRLRPQASAISSRKRIGDARPNARHHGACRPIASRGRRIAAEGAARRDRQTSSGICATRDHVEPVAPRGTDAEPSGPRAA